MWLCCRDRDQLSLADVKPLRQHSPVRWATLPEKPQVQLAEHAVPKIDFGQPAIAEAQLWLPPKPVDGSQHEVPASAASTTCSPRSFRWRTFRPCFGGPDENLGDVEPLGQEDVLGCVSHREMQVREITDVTTPTPRQSQSSEAASRRSRCESTERHSQRCEDSPESPMVSAGETTARDSLESFPSEFGEEFHCTTANRSTRLGPGTSLENIDEVPMHLPQIGGRNHITTLREPLYSHDHTAMVNEVGLGLKAMTVLDNS